MESENVDWLPLESNPEVVNKFLQKLGFDTSTYSLVDVFSTEEWAQQMVPQPVLAVFLLYPITKNQKEYNAKQNENYDPQTVSPNVFFMKQYAENACGTIAVFHAIGNIMQSYQDLVQKGSTLEKFFEIAKPLSPEERGKSFKRDKTLETAHKEAVHEGETKVTSKASGHFISFVEVDGSLYELDGGKAGPINHGRCRSSELLSKTCEVIQKIIERDPGELRFTIMALSFSKDLSAFYE